MTNNGLSPTQITQENESTYQKEIKKEMIFDYISKQFEISLQNLQNQIKEADSFLHKAINIRIDLTKDNNSLRNETLVEEILPDFEDFSSDLTPNLVSDENIIINNDDIEESQNNNETFEIETTDIIVSE